MANWKKKVADARASGGGDYLGNGADGSGRVIVKDLRMIEVYGEEYQFTATFQVKSSNPDPRYPGVKPEAVGEERSHVSQLTKFESAPSNMKGVLVAIDPDLAAMGPEEFDKTLDEILRLAPKDDAGKGWQQGRTMPNTTCLARGVELAYKTRRKMTRGTPTNPSHEITVVDFSAVADQTEESIVANVALLK